MTDELLVKYLLGEASDAEEKKVQQWTQAAEANRTYYEQLKQIWDASGDLVPKSTVDENEAWRRFQDRVVNKGKVKKAKGNSGDE